MQTFRLDTIVGPRGVRLSGGQVQRTSAARMFVTDAELLVFDDLSSALDVDTEKKLWARVFSTPSGGRENEKVKTNGHVPAYKSSATCLVVSHRKSVLQRADNIIVMKGGKIEAQGKLNELLEASEEMQRLWDGDLGSADDG